MPGVTPQNPGILPDPPGATERTQIVARRATPASFMPDRVWRTLPRAPRVSERSAVAGMTQSPNRVLNRDEDAPRVPPLCAETQCMMRVIDHAHRVLSCMAGVIHRSNGSSMPRIALARQHMDSALTRCSLVSLARVKKTKPRPHITACHARTLR